MPQTSLIERYQSFPYLFIDQMDVPSFFYSLDQVIGGFRKGALTILAGSPGVGTSTLALSIALRQSKRFSVAYVLTNPCSDYFQRCIIHNCVGTHLPEEQYAYYDEVLKETQHSSFCLINDTGDKYHSIKHAIYQHVREQICSCVIVDFLQDIILDDLFPHSDRRKQLNAICADLRSLAHELEIPIILLAHASDLPQNLLLDCHSADSVLPTINDVDAKCSADLVMYLTTNGCEQIQTQYSSHTISRLIVLHNAFGGKGEVLLKSDFSLSCTTPLDSVEDTKFYPVPPLPKSYSDNSSPF
jgi:replicative DNA helicase